MIYVIRTEAPEKLTEKGQIERGLAVKHFEVDNKSSSFEFNIYSKKYVKKALKKLFNKKCAYCESFLFHIEHPHIEHWRPKGGVTEEKEHKGYYWLAADWDNLFLACGVCNSSFKRNQFPIEPCSSYAKKSNDDCLILEKPLLINPCVDNPELYVNFTDEGTIQPVYPLSLKGLKSIEVYGLNREDLNLQRKFHAKHTVINRLDDIIEDIFEFQDKQESLIKRTIRNIEDLKCYINDEAQYIGMTKSIIKRYRLKYQDIDFFLEVTKGLV